VQVQLAIAEHLALAIMILRVSNGGLKNTLKIVVKNA
jgi:hypothetical protein